MIKVIIPAFLFIMILTGGCKSTSCFDSSTFCIMKGDVNGAVITSGLHHLVIYGDPENHLTEADMLLCTHARRDLLWAAGKLVNGGTKLVVPENELPYFTRSDSVWNSMAENQFHDYRLKSPKVPTEPFEVYRSVKGGDSILWQGIPIKVIDSRGYSEGAVSYLVHIEDKDIAFVGDLIYGDGQIMDIYSMQDEIPELDVWAYHGYAARMADLIHSLNRIAALKPDILVPARGPVITDPQQSISLLISRLQALYQNYLSVNAFRWYTSQGWGGNAEVHQEMAARVLPSDCPVNWMPMARRGQNPPWLLHHHNSKMIVSEDGTSFLIDCGNKEVLDELLNPTEAFSCGALEGIFITHYYDDHTQYINEITDRYHCPVYTTKELEDVLKRPHVYHLPALSSDPVEKLSIVPEAGSISWKEFTFTLFYFPAQTIYHAAMLVEHKNGESIFLAGDAFSPAGMDDYCLQNRNFIQPGMGYLYCLDLLKKMPAKTWIVNQHIEQPFRFTNEQLNCMTDRLIERKALMQELFPWEDPNYGIDEGWARIYPYRQDIQAGRSASFSVIIFNHGKQVQEYTIHPSTGELPSYPEELVISVNPLEEGIADFTLEVPAGISNNNLVITADVAFNKWKLHSWCESIVKIEKNEDLKSL